MIKLSRYALALPLCLAFALSAGADDWPQWRGPQRDGVWRESGIVGRLPAELSFRWRVPIGGGFAGPVVVGDRVYVFDRIVAPGQEPSENKWNNTAPVDGNERILCLDASSGKVVWKHEYASRYEISYACGPRATPTVSDGRVYTVGAMGEVRCLDAHDGSLRWSKNYVRDFGTTMNPWGMSAAPLVEGDLLILLAGGADGACVVALDKVSGEEAWRSLDCSDPGYSSPIVVESDGTRQLIVWNPLGLYSLNPSNGEIYWDQPFPIKMGHSIASPAFDARQRLVFITSFFDGPVMMQLEAGGTGADALWHGSSHSERSPDGLHGLMCTPSVDSGHVFGVCGYGQLRCLDAMSGEQIWETLEATGENRWSNAFLVKHEDRHFICNEHGELILAKLTPEGYEELGRAPLIEPTVNANRRMVVWSHPAFANRCVYARNDNQLVCADLSAEKKETR